MPIIATLAAAISAVVSSLRNSARAEKEARGTASLECLFKLLNVVLYWIEKDGYLSPEDKENIGSTFQSMINSLTDRFDELASPLSDPCLEKDLADLLRSLLWQYSTYKGAYKLQRITSKRSTYDSLVLTSEMSELNALRSEAPATDTDTSKVDHSLDLSPKSGISRQHQLASCYATKKFIYIQLKEPDLSFVLCPLVLDWLADLDESYHAMKNMSSYSLPKAAKGMVSDVDKLLLEMTLWQRNLEAFATSVAQHRQFSDERDRLITQLEARGEAPSAASCCSKFFSCW